MPTEALVILADAHLGAAGVPPAERLYAFLERVPEHGNHLILAGDLFEFFFVNRRAIPRSAKPTLQALARLRARGIAVSVVGGNHDRWARDAWEREVGATFDPEVLRFRWNSRTVEVRHGDGLAEPDVLSRALGWLVRRRLVIGAVGLVPPDTLEAIVRPGARGLAGRKENHAEAARAQDGWVRDRLAAPDAPDLLVLGHTHVPVAMQVGARWYVNPGAWMDGGFAVVPAEGPPRLLRADAHPETHA